MRAQFLILALALAGVAAGATPAAALPDLVPEVFGVSLGIGNVDPGDVVEGCAGGETGRRLLRFSLRARNVGASDLVMGNPGCPDCATHPDAECANPLFHCSAAHGHAHFEGFARMELLTAQGALVGESFKQSFCLLDAECGSPQFSCAYQGISAGCADVYDASLPCQYIDLTDATVPNGSYVLRVHLDPDDLIAESNEANNVLAVPVEIGISATPTCPVYISGDVPKAIPDMGSTTSILDVPALPPITRLRLVGLRGEHSFVRDLEVHLQSPLGTDVTVMNRVCGDFDFFSLDLADGASTVIPCPPDDGGLHQPSSPLGAFIGEPPGGAWTLQAFDRETLDDGTLEEWGLEICGPCGNGVLDAGEQCDDGNGLDGDCCSADCQTLAADGTPCSDDDACTSSDACAAGTCSGGATVACDPCLACYPSVGCVPPFTTVCQSAPPSGSRLALRKPLLPGRERLTWRWKNATPMLIGDFGLPASSTDLQLCLFDQQGLKVSASAPAGGICRNRDCWTTGSETAIAYRDPDLTPDGLLQLSLRAGASSRARIAVRGQGPSLDLPALDLTPPVTARLKRGDGSPICWEARFGSASRRTPQAFDAESD